MCEDVQNYCRICLDIKSTHVSIFDDPTVHLHIKSCLSMTISTNDHLPKVVCVSCVSQLNEFYNFQLNARCSQDWLETSLEEKCKKQTDTKTPIQPLPDSEYNSDSLLEFLNNTANIEEYLNNLGKEDIPSIVNMFDRNNENSLEVKLKPKVSPKKKDTDRQRSKINDDFDSEMEVVQEVLIKKPKLKSNLKIDKTTHTCFACKIKLDSINKLSQHLSICDLAVRTCIYCNKLFDSKQKMQEHCVTHSTLTCVCGKKLDTKETMLQHQKICHSDIATLMGCMYRCKQCGETFKERFQLYKHVKVHLVKAEKRVCDICGHSFAGDDLLAKHRLEEHKKLSNEMYRCKICSYTTKDHKEIYAHVQKHTAKKEHPRHLCESCGCSFATHATLMRHSLQHGNTFQCIVCKKKFVDEKARDIHVLEHKEAAICERCGATVNAYKLDAHSCV